MVMGLGDLSIPDSNTTALSHKNFHGGGGGKKGRSFLDRVSAALGICRETTITHILPFPPEKVKATN
jgi:hypothetical protein